MMMLERLSSTIFIRSFKLQDVVGMTHTSTAKTTYSVLITVRIATLDTNFGSLQLLPDFLFIEASRLLACAQLSLFVATLWMQLLRIRLEKIRRLLGMFSCNVVESCG